MSGIRIQTRWCIEREHRRRVPIDRRDHCCCDTFRRAIETDTQQCIDDQIRARQILARTRDDRATGVMPLHHRLRCGIARR